MGESDWESWGFFFFFTVLLVFLFLLLTLVPVYCNGFSFLSLLSFGLVLVCLLSVRVRIRDGREVGERGKKEVEAGSGISKDGISALFFFFLTVTFMSPVPVLVFFLLTCTNELACLLDWRNGSVGWSMVHQWMRVFTFAIFCCWLVLLLT